MMDNELEKYAKKWYFYLKKSMRKRGSLHWKSFHREKAEEYRIKVLNYKKENKNDNEGNN